MSERLPAHLEAAALRRAAEGAGGSGMILARGDAERGSLVLLLAERGMTVAVLERRLAIDGRYGWERVAERQLSDPHALRDWCARRRGDDPDLWLIELDIPQAERFIVENGLSG